MDEKKNSITDDSSYRIKKMIESKVKDHLEPLVKLVEQNKKMMIEQEKTKQELQASMRELLENDNLVAMVEENRAELARLQKANASLEEQKDKKSKHLQSIEKKQQSLQRELSYHTNEIQKTESSTSWKITAPIRKMGSVLKKRNKH